MPELPEVETIARQLNNSLKDKTVEEVIVYRQNNFFGEIEKLMGQKVFRVFRKAKMLLIEFLDCNFVMAVHLKMTGQLIYVKEGEDRVAGGHPTSDWVASLPNKYTRVELVFGDGSRLFFNDIRAFGWVKILSETERDNLLDRLPFDVVDIDFDFDYFCKITRKTNRSIKTVLLDQSLIGGIGNIYANDALNMAKILPSRKASSIRDEENAELYKSIKSVIDLGIEKGGASAANYVDTRGLGGSYQNYFLTYKRDGHPCKNCGSILKKSKLGGRGTYFCDNCQK